MSQPPNTHRGHRFPAEIISHGVVNLTTDGRWSASSCSASHDRWNPGHIASSAEGGIAGLTVFTGRQTMTAKLKMVVDPAVIGQETLRVTG